MIETEHLLFSGESQRQAWTLIFMLARLNIDFKPKLKHKSEEVNCIANYFYAFPNLLIHIAGQDLAPSTQA